MSDDVIIDPPWTSITKLELVPRGAIDALRQKLLRKQLKHINTEQTLRSTRQRYQELKEDYAVLKLEFDELRAAWDALMDWKEQT